MIVSIAKNDPWSRTILQFLLVVWSNVWVAKTTECLEIMIIRNFPKKSLKWRLIFKYLGR